MEETTVGVPWTVFKHLTYVDALKLTLGGVETGHIESNI